ncbi:MAG: HAD family hydrolase [Candidatus Wallbacteria bacterium]|nr:HAD family hydrolase [Candidatus Wallbacteria bacterium]
MSKLILFDIDGTLIDTDEAGRHAFELAFMECTHKDMSQLDYSLCGKTDLQVIDELLGILDIEMTEELVEQILENYVNFLPYELKIAEKPRILPGVAEIISELAAHDDLHLGLLTGNIRESAYLKLDFFKLESYFPTGAYGDDARDRPNLFPIAVSRCEKKFGCSFPLDQIFLVGDAPGDINCAHENSARIIAVASGHTSYEELELLKPDYLLSDLSEINDFMNIIGGGNAE